MARMKREVLRKCTGCGSMKDRKDLIRIIRNEEGQVLVDDTQKRNGRGAYLCRSASCVETARKRHALERDLNCSVDRSVYDLIREKTEASQ